MEETWPVWEVYKFKQSRRLDDGSIFNIFPGIGKSCKTQTAESIRNEAGVGVWGIKH